jgi:hypothetical protein
VILSPIFQKEVHLKNFVLVLIGATVVIWFCCILGDAADQTYAINSHYNGAYMAQR